MILSIILYSLKAKKDGMDGSFIFTQSLYYYNTTRRQQQQKDRFLYYFFCLCKFLKELVAYKGKNLLPRGPRQSLR